MLHQTAGNTTTFLFSRIPNGQYLCSEFLFSITNRNVQSLDLWIQYYIMEFSSPMGTKPAIVLCTSKSNDDWRKKQIGPTNPAMLYPYTLQYVLRT